MSIESKRKITVDVNNSKYIKVEAKQNDINSRYLVVALACNGKAIEIDPENHSAFVRMRKPDGYGVFNACAIEDNNIVIALTEQMLAKAGVCDLDIMLVENAEVEMVDGTINVLSGTILSSMLIHIDVIASALNNSTIESSYEYEALNQLMIETTAKYEMVKDYSKKYSDLAKEYSEDSKAYRDDTYSVLAECEQAKNITSQNLQESIDNKNQIALYKEETKEYRDEARAIVGDHIAGIKGASESEYTRSGDYLITPEKIGAMRTTEIPDWAKQPTKPSYTKAEVGLGNVDNTSDASKSVLYAETSNVANSVVGSAKVVISDEAPADTSVVWIQ